MIIASDGGYVKVVELLVTQDGVNVNSTARDFMPPDHELPEDDSWPTQSPLLLAAEGGHLDVLKVLLDQPGVDPRFTNSAGWSVLHYAVAAECESALKLLFAHRRTSADVDGTLLVFAFHQRKFSATRLLLDEVPLRMDLDRVEAVDLLDRALNLSLTDIVKKLLLLPSARTQSQYVYEYDSPLAFATVHGDTGTVASLLADPMVDPNRQEFCGHTPLALAVCMENEEIFKLLLDHADLTIADNQGRLPLWLAASLGYAELVKLLLGKNVDVNVGDGVGDPPLNIASEFGHVAVVKLLLEREEIEVNVRSNSGQTPLVAAVCSSHMEVVKALLETKRVHLTGEETEPPLLAAVEIGSLAMVELLLRMEGLDPNASLPHPGAHPLAAAASQGRFEIVERLLRGDLAIDVNFVDSSGCTALDWALNRDDWESQSCDRREAIAELLRSKGALRGQELLSPACSAQPQLQGEGT